MYFSFLKLGRNLALAGLISLPVLSTLSKADDSDGFRMFEKQVYSVLRERGCQECHGTGGRSPEHSQDDAEKAYRAVLPYVNFARPEGSPLVIRSSNTHCGNSKICGLPPGDLIAAVEQWAQVEASEIKALGFQDTQDSMKGWILSNAVTVPDKLPSRTEPPAELTWDFKDRGLSIRASIQRLGEDGYRINTPHFVLTGKQGLQIKGLRFVLNGQWRPKYDAFGDVERKVSVLRSIGVSGRILRLPEEKPTGNQLTVAVREITPIDANEMVCGAVPIFEQRVMPILRAHDCASCHGSAPNSPFSMAGSTERLCSLMYEAAAAPEFLQSELARAIYKGVGHPPVLTHEDLIKGFVPWLDEEKRARTPKETRP